MEVEAEGGGGRRVEEEEEVDESKSPRSSRETEFAAAMEEGKVKD